MPNTAHTKEVRRESAPRALSRPRVTPTLLLLAAVAALSIASARSLAQKKPAPKASAPAKKARSSSTEKSAPPARASVPAETLLQIIEAEDERRWDASEFGKLFEGAN